jgi:transposase
MGVFVVCDGESGVMCSPAGPSYEELVALVTSLREVIVGNTSTISALQEHIALLEAEIARLSSGRPGGGTSSAPRPPSWVKPNTPTPPVKKARKKRDRGCSRRRQEPTEIYEHAVDVCPDCGRTLTGGWLHDVREVIEIPAMPLRVIHHHLISRHCGVCGKDHAGRPDLSGQVVGNHRFGVRLMSLVAHLSHVGRMPLRTIQSLLKSLYGLHISVGAISDMLHAVAGRAAPTYAKLRDAIRGSPYVHADETSWRENGVNGYVWSFSTPSIRLFALDRSRGHQVPEGVLGPDYAGILCSDFYSGYSYHLGEHQYCWVHLQRDLKALVEAHPEDGSLQTWVKQVRLVHKRAKKFGHASPKVRRRARTTFQRQAEELGQRYAQTETPQHTLANRLLRFSSGLFTFVEFPEVPSHNNPAERSIRPIVIKRKISGGTRSAAGSTTSAILMSMFGTWKAQNHDPLDACRQMLLAPTP